MGLAFRSANESQFHELRNYLHCLQSATS
jgi:hypothetical protein